MKPTRYMAIIRLTVVLFMTIALFRAAPVFADDAKTLANAMQEQKTPADMKEKWGIEVVAVRMAVAGNMVDFRYRVLDAEKADSLFSKKTRPYLIHQETGKVLAVPRTAKVGPLMSSYHPKENRIYWMFFGNQTKLVKAGDKVTVVISDFKQKDLLVQ